MIVLLALLCTIFANAAVAQNYLDYYHTIARAEEAVVTGKYTSALTLYSNAFDSFSYNNPIDCYVAAQVAAYTNDTSRCLAFLRGGISFGLPQQTVSTNPHLSAYVSGGLLTQTVIDSCWSVHMQHINTTARTRALALIRYDQYFIRHLPSGPFYGRDGQTLRAVYVPIYDSLLREIIDITKTAGFPAQKVIGTQHGDDGLFRTGPNSVYVYYIFVHHGNAWPLTHELLWNELQKGNITPQMYGAIADHSNRQVKDTDMPYMALRECDSRACEKRVKERLAQLNAARWEIGLCSYEVMKAEHTSRRLYTKWCKDKSAKPEPVFDFQNELHFMGLTD